MIRRLGRDIVRNRGLERSEVRHNTEIGPSMERRLADTDEEREEGEGVRKNKTVRKSGGMKAGRGSYEDMERHRQESLKKLRAKMENPQLLEEPVMHHSKKKKLNKKK